MTGERIVAAARAWIGTPYRHQASLRGIGCDCLGLLRGVWRDTHGPEPEAPPPYSRDWAEAAGREALIEAASRHLVPAGDRPIAAGDVLMFRWRRHLPAQHCAIATSAAAMVHAHEGAAVTEVEIAAFWRQRLVAVFAFPEVRP